MENQRSAVFILMLEPHVIAGNCGTRVIKTDRSGGGGGSEIGRGNTIKVKRNCWEK
jgi:hypothetical protein